MRTVQILMTVEIADDATTGPDYGNDTVTPEFLAEYAHGAGEHLFGGAQGVTVTAAEIA